MSFNTKESFDGFSNREFPGLKCHWEYSDSKPEPVIYKEYRASDIYNIALNIPKYQRIYTWGYEQVNTLLNDICNIKNIERYFTGAVILHKRTVNGSEVYDIVDGQQRLVTTALIYYALHEKDTIALPSGVSNFLNCEYASLEAQQHISENYKTILRFLNDEHRRALISQNLPRLYFSALIIDRADNLDLAFTFFSNTNSKGKKLTDYDLLKPHHLRYIPSDLEDQQLHLASKWDDMINSARNVKTDNKTHPDDRAYIPYVRLMELMLFRLRNWEQMQQANDAADHYLKKEFEAAPTISEIPSFGEQFHFGEPIQGGQHFFAYVDHFIDEYNKFGMTDDYNKYVIDKQEFGLKNIIQYCFGKCGSHSWYGTVIEALVFCYFLKFGNNYIAEATMSIVRYISIIRFRSGRAYKPTINDWALNSKIVIEISKATSPTFFLAAIENKIDIALSDSSARKEDAESGIRERYLNYCCKGLTHSLMKKTKVQHYKTYFDDRYGMLC